MENQSGTSNLDPDVVNLAKAIRQTESGGNPTARGKSGEFGAYQFTAPTWEAASKKYGVNVPLEQSTLQQQNEVAYKQLKEWKDSGNNVGQIASMWNAGENAKDAYLDDSHVGVNKFGVKYNVPAYAKSVATAYQQLKGGSQVGADPNNPSSTANPSGVMNLTNPITNPDTSGGPIGQGFGLEEASVNQTTQPLATSQGDYAGKESEFTKGLGELAGVSGVAAIAVPLLAAGGALATGTALTTAGAATTDVAEGGGFLSKIGTGLSKLFNLGTKAAALKEVSDTVGGVLGGNKDTSFQSGVNQSQQKSSALADSLMQAMNATPTGRVAMQNPDTQQAVQTAAMYGYAPELGENNSMDFARAQKKSFEDVATLHEGVAKALDAEGESAQIQEAVSRAKENARQFAPSSEWEDVDKNIDQLAGTYEKNFGKQGRMSLGNFMRMKSEMGKNQKFGLLETSATKNARKALSMGARGTIEEHTKHKELFNRTMKEEQNIIKAREVMKRLNGKKATDNTSLKRIILHRVSRDFSIYLGDKIGGPIGAIVGGIMGEQLSGAVDKKYGRSIFETPAMKKVVNELQKSHPDVYNYLTAELKKHGERPTEGNVVDLVKQAADTKKGIDAKELVNLPKYYEKKRDARLKKELKKGSLLAGRSATNKTGNQSQLKQGLLRQGSKQS